MLRQHQTSTLPYNIDTMGGPNLEVFKVRLAPKLPLTFAANHHKFGMYIMFPISIMYYFGTNLDEKFSVPDFWPKRGETHTIPFEKDEINEELARLKQRRLAARARRLELEGRSDEPLEQPQSRIQAQTQTPSPMLQSLERSDREGPASGVGQQGGKGWFSWLK